MRIERTHFTHGALATLLAPALLAGLLAGAAPARAQLLSGDSQDEAEAGDNAPLTVRGKYAAGELNAEWEAMVEDGRPARIVEWRHYGQHGDANVVFDFHRGNLMHYGEQSRRVAGQAGVADGYRKITLNLKFNSEGRYVGGRKQVDGIDTEPDEPEIQAAMAQARAALERLAATKSGWSERGSMTSFSRQATRPTVPPPPAPPQERTRPGEVAFRCAEGLRVVLGAPTLVGNRQADSLVVEQEGRPPAPLLRQPPDGRYEFLGRGWAATRFGDTIQLESAGGQAWTCHVVIAVPPASDVPVGNPSAPASDLRSSNDRPGNDRDILRSRSNGAATSLAPTNTNSDMPLPTISIPGPRR
ncbi:hypothetical protein V6B08_02380 [Ferrovibrio sp. MS7]|uniref:hypothetical protein n=1 Tax=Ferrovibrio plantarum TaxID=3119164 RepID=UPI003136BC4F